ncbi:hypothetical protein B0T26DRAFT_747153 [Lasiosphaeria miniovina]|uniref:Uncharacterized protein n=1 Tax=Lasiosphaeria miniovina TaxID=1954250 RepID=A0AA40E6E0_9PEZI|nr:uncharacterized protein B0T26DRAFT_747153 [Lasiosphaeria miniovina]KAK0726742.1 hypothetical protein B0T26DRAFT_747153 [Lasiosphaeria miniovina]
MAQQPDYTFDNDTLLRSKGTATHKSGLKCAAQRMPAETVTKPFKWPAEFPFGVKVQDDDHIQYMEVLSPIVDRPLLQWTKVFHGIKGLGENPAYAAPEQLEHALNQSHMLIPDASEKGCVWSLGLMALALYSSGQGIQKPSTPVNRQMVIRFMDNIKTRFIACYQLAAEPQPDAKRLLDLIGKMIQANHTDQSGNITGNDRISLEQCAEEARAGLHCVEETEKIIQRQKEDLIKHKDDKVAHEKAQTALNGMTAWLSAPVLKGDQWKGVQGRAPERFIKHYEHGYADETIADIIQKMCPYGVFSKRYEGIGMGLKERQMLGYRNDSYDGMGGRDLMAAAASLYQVTDRAYIASRIRQVQTYAQKLLADDTLPNVVITRGKTMRLRYFSAGLRPVLVFLDNPDATARDELMCALALATGGWGQTRTRAPSPSSSWTSGVGNDRSLIEFSVSIPQTPAAAAELRFLTEAQPPKTHLTRHLFLNPDSPPETIQLTTWHSCAWSTKKSRLQWKIYLDPRAAGEAVATTREAFRLLGLEAGWRLMESILMPPPPATGTKPSSGGGIGNSIIYFSLDLPDDDKDDEARRGRRSTTRMTKHDKDDEARVKVVAQKHARFCPDADAYEVQRFLMAMAAAAAAVVV